MHEYAGPTTKGVWALSLAGHANEKYKVHKVAENSGVLQNLADFGFSVSKQCRIVVCSKIWQILVLVSQNSVE